MEMAAGHGGAESCRAPFIRCLWLSIQIGQVRKWI